MLHSALRLDTPAPWSGAPTRRAAATPAPDRPTMGQDRFVRSTPEDRQQAVTEARAILHEKKFDAEAGRNVPTRRIEKDAIDSSAWVWGKNKQEAKRRIAKNEALVADRLEAFTPTQRAQYEAVAKMVGQVSPAATLALQNLLLSDRLPGDRPNKDGHDLLTALHTLTQPGTKLAPPVDRHQLLRHLIREVAEPASINQRQWGTCATTSLQMIVAMKDPAEFVRIVTGLASPKGEVTLRGGETAKRVKGTARPTPLAEKFQGRTYHSPDERSISTRLFSAAFMDLGNGDDTYDNRTDRHGKGGGGLMDLEVRKAVAGALGLEIDTVVPEDAPFTPDSPVIDRLRKATESGMPISVGMEWGEADENGQVHGGHEVIVMKVVGDQVHIMNPWGTEETIGLKAFAERVGALHFPQGM